MSGIVGILNLDGAPADKHLLRVLTNSLKLRGPDAQQIWLTGPVGFGHSLFKTTEESENESQPFTLGTGSWITADARVDRQSELIVKLNAQGQHLAHHPTDAELILRAYEAWGESCVEHLLGDFAFGIWDSRQNVLFCARDHMGVRPFYYAQVGTFVIFSSTVDCVRRCSSVSDRLNDLAIADFLLFGCNQDKSATAFTDVRRLPPAHCIQWSNKGTQIRSYWTMPIDEPIFFKKKNDYSDRFKELLRIAVGDRLRTPKIGVFMSGGLDSPTLAATAKDLLGERYPSYDLVAITSVDDRNPEDRYYPGLVAKKLNIPIQYFKWNNERQDRDWQRTPFYTAEPFNNGRTLEPNRLFRQSAGSFSRVFFWGEGPDNALLMEYRPYLSYLSANHDYGRLLRGIGSTFLTQRRIPFWGRISRKIIELRRGNKTDGEREFPDWLEPKLVSRLDLRSRWNEYWHPSRTSPHPLRPEGYLSLQFPLWQHLFEGEDAGSTETFFEMRYPYIDLRMLRFLLSVPPLPWCRSKYLIRYSMHGILPPAVLRRKKVGIPAERQFELNSNIELFSSVPELHEYADPKPLFNNALRSHHALQELTRVRGLNHWLQYSKKQLHNDTSKEGSNEYTGQAIAGNKAGV